MDTMFASIRKVATPVATRTVPIYVRLVAHGVPEERKRRYKDDALSLLDDHLEGLSGIVGQTIFSQAKGMR